MKLIIDIPKELKQKIDEGFTNQVIINKLWDATKNGIPLEQIRAEIVGWRKEPARYIPNYDAYKRFLELIDEYR